MSAAHLRITGHVQGVFFRAETKRKADELGLKGWVRNTDDGSVEIHAEGSDEALSKLQVWCHEGPAAAQVEHVGVSSVPEEDHQEFTVTQ